MLMPVVGGRSCSTFPARTTLQLLRPPLPSPPLPFQPRAEGEGCYAVTRAVGKRVPWVRMAGCVPHGRLPSLPSLCVLP